MTDYEMIKESLKDFPTTFMPEGFQKKWIIFTYRGLTVTYLFSKDGNLEDVKYEKIPDVYVV